jgi:hypothetical protein
MRDRWATCSAYLPHVYAVLDFKEARSRDELVSKATLLHHVAAYFFSQGAWIEAERFQGEAVTLRNTVVGSDHHDTLTSLGDLACTFRNQGRWEEAEKLQMQVTETSKSKLGPKHPAH